ncbi:MAG: hypothetical protein GWN71_34065, partial [Gammaproteobacteria bacterium]|nr:hypothetical protein [Actinomycetota bacterium]NIU78404.1 hypothetical protein [Gammaproteobacteria bacterium]
FTATPPDTGPVDIPVTTFVRRLVDPDREDEDRATVLAALSAFEGSTFGYTEFASIETGAPPRLRLIVSAVNPERIQ